MNNKAFPSLEDFTLARRGLLNKAFERLKLGGTSGKQTATRILIIIAITWVPLLVLAAFQGQLFNQNIDIPFWKDFSCHCKFLVIIPILIFAEISVDFHLKELTAQFFRSGIIDKSGFDGFEAVRKKVRGLVETYWADIIILVIIVINVVLRLQKLENDKISIWFVLPGSDTTTLSWSGIYYGIVSLPFIQFIMLRWLWLWIIWIIYFSRISKLPLKLTSAHPDKAGGLGFLGFPPSPFIQVLFALAILFSVTIAESIVLLEQELPAFYPVMAGFTFLTILMNLLPLLVFTKPLLRQRRKGLFEYTALIHEHHIQFDGKWFEKPHENELTGMSDASSMADLNGSFEIVKGMKLFPFDIKIMVSSILIAIVPMIPLLAFEYNVVELIVKVLKMLA